MRHQALSRARLSIALGCAILVTGSVCAIANGDEARECRIRYLEIPRVLQGNDLPRDIFRDAGGTVRALKPRAEGFFVVRVEGAVEQEEGPIYFRKFQESPLETQILKLESGSGGLDWSTVAHGGRLVGKVPPGHYRMVLEYVAADGQPTSKSSKQEICVAISGVFEIKDGFSLYTLE